MAMPGNPKRRNLALDPYPSRTRRPPPNVSELARSHTRRAIQVLAKISYDEEQPGSTRVAAASLLLERGWGKVPQAVTGADGDGGIEVIIRHLVEPAPEPAKVIGHDDDDGE
jgi:hypothetical protein